MDVKVSPCDEGRCELDKGLDRTEKSRVSRLPSNPLRDFGFGVALQLMFEVVGLQLSVAHHWRQFTQVFHSLNPKTQNICSMPPIMHNHASRPPSGGGPTSGCVASDNAVAGWS